VLDHPWAIEPSMLAIVAGILGRHMAGLPTDDGAVAAALVNRQKLPQPPGGGVAVIPMYGVIAPRMNLMSEMSGGTSFQELSGQLAQALADPKVSTIVLDIDSPGGSVAGASEFADEVRQARTVKPIIAQAQYKMASAAYWVATSATKIYASPSALVGSVGVYTIHDDISKALSALGVTRTYISAGKHKIAGNPSTPLDADTLALMKVPIDQAYAQFVGDISKGRGVPLADVRNGYGEGLAVTAADALGLGMIDGIATLAQTIARAQKGEPTPRTSPATNTPQEPSQATGQDWRRTHERQRFELELALL
jgi:signal peptide peptidase SppA